MTDFGLMSFYKAEHGDGRPLTTCTIAPGHSARFRLVGVPPGANLTLRSSNPTRATMTMLTRHSAGSIHLLEWETSASDIATDAVEATTAFEYLVQLNAARTTLPAPAPTVIVARASFPGNPIETKSAELWVTTDHELAERLATYVRRLLNDCLPKSIPEQREYGGVIYLSPRTGTLGHTQYAGVPPVGKVDIKQDEPNMACPAGTTPVAWYHTHPFEKNSQGFSYLSHEFVEHDKDLSDVKILPGYLGVFDGSFWRYDPAPLPHDNSYTDPVTFKPIQIREGHFVQLPETLRTK